MIDFVLILLSPQNGFACCSGPLLRLKRIHLLARSTSPFIQSSVKKTLVDTWLELFCIDADMLTATDRILLDFIASGITSVLGDSRIIDDPGLMGAFPTSLIGKAAIQTLQSLPKKKMQ